MNEKRANNQINKRKKKAEVILNDETKSAEFADSVDAKFNKTVSKKKPLFFSQKIKDMASYIPLFNACVRSYIKGEYREIPVGAIIAVVAALIYFVSPIDLIPDFIPGIGYIDDAGVLGFCFLQFKSDLDVYKEWQRQQSMIIDGQIKKR